MTESDPIPRRKLYQEVVDRLLQRIQDGSFPPGRQLPSERRLMEMFQVGRPAVREALLTLERMGLIAISHGERARVLTPTAASMIDQVADTARHFLTTSAANLEHLKEARLFFELGMVRIAAQRASAAEIARMEAALAAQQEAARGDTSRFLARDMAFHRAIAAVSGNPIYTALSQAIFSWLAEFHIELVRLPGSEQLSLAEHGEILAGVKARDPEAAEAAMTRHLTRANALYRLYEEGAPTGPSRGVLLAEE
jgi:GntR family transcriptional regulator, sialic acid-inducible nan operon repressor